MNGVTITLGIILVAYLGLCAVMFFLQRSLLYFPQPRAVVAPQSTMHLPVDGADLIITIRPHEGDKAIVYFGGNGEDVSQNLVDFSSAFPDYALYLMSYRGFGGSTGQPTEKANFGDAETLYKKVRAHHPDVAIIGRSLGTGVAVHLASQVQASHLLLITPYDAIVDLAASRYWFVPVHLLILDRYESRKYAPSIKTPTTILEAENDEVIPRSSTEALLGRFPAGIASMTVISGVGHNDIGQNPLFMKTMQAILN